jgi:hypothetical protein
LKCFCLADDQRRQRNLRRGRDRHAGAVGHQRAHQGDQVQRNEEEDRRRQHRQRFFLELVKLHFSSIPV